MIFIKSLRQEVIEMLEEVERNTKEKQECTNQIKRTSKESVDNALK